MYDASAKIPSGILSGNVNQFGDFDSCLKVDDQKLGIKGQYCLTYVEMTLPPNANDKLKHVFDLMHSHSAFRSRLEDVSVIMFGADESERTFRTVRSVVKKVINFDILTMKQKAHVARKPKRITVHIALSL